MARDRRRGPGHTCGSSAGWTPVKPGKAPPWGWGVRGVWGEGLGVSREAVGELAYYHVGLGASLLRRVNCRIHCIHTAPEVTPSVGAFLFR